MFTTATGSRRSRTWKMRGATAALTLAALMSLGIAGAAVAAPAHPGNSAPRNAIRSAESSSRPAAASGKQCFYEVPDCVSSNTTGAFGVVAQGDNSSCTFTGTVTWGDGQTTSQSYSGGSAGSVLAEFSHTYTDGPNDYSINWSEVVNSGSCPAGSATLQFTLFPCPDGGTHVTLPQVNAPVLLSGKPFSLSYGRLPLTFFTVAGASDSVCRATSNIGALPVILNVKAGSFHIGDSVASATLDFLPADDPSTEVPACDFSALKALISAASALTPGDFIGTSNCLLTGDSSHTTGTVIVRWSIPGFAEYVPSYPSGDKLYQTPALTYYADLTQLGLTPTSSFQDDVQKAETFIHTTLVSNLPMVDRLGLVQDPPASLLVTDPLGRTVGLDASGKVETFPGAGYAKIGNRTLAWIFEPVPGTYHVTADGKPDSQFHTDFTVLQFLGHGKDPLRANTSWRGTLGHNGKSSRMFSAKGASLQPQIKASESRTRAVRHQVVRFSLTAIFPFGKLKKAVWAFGDGKQATGKTASHRYAHADRFTPEVTVTDALGTSVTIKLKTIVVRRLK